MAKSPLCHPLNCSVIRKFIENLEKIISSNTSVLSSNIEKHFGPSSDTVYLRGSILFINSSTLDIAILAKESLKAISIEKYRFHYMDKHSQMLFRYDDAPHHHELSSFPHHKHVGNRTVPSPQPDLKDVFNEINAIILKK